MAGRPGGNEGREEWGGGLSYGQTNGDWVLASTNKGDVSSLNKGEGAARAIGFGILGLIPQSKAAAAGITAAGIVKELITKDVYAGNYYIADIYSSGRSIKTVITTYSDTNYKNQASTYTHIQQW